MPQHPTASRKVADCYRDEIGGLDRHVMAGLEHPAARARNGTRDWLDQRRRSGAVEAAGHHQHGAVNARQLVRHVEMDEHAIDRRVASRIVAEPARTERCKARAVGAQLGRISVGHCVGDHRPHALALQAIDPGEQRRTAVRRDRNCRAADDDGGDPLRETHRHMERNRAAYRDAGERDLAADREGIEEGGQVVRHHVDGEGAAHLLGKSSAARVIGEHTPLSCKHRRDLIPALE
jgi:hypothetical protein